MREVLTEYVRKQINKEKIMGRKIAKAKQIRAYVDKKPDDKPKERGLAFSQPPNLLS
jgi:hypothetical protein